MFQTPVTIKRTLADIEERRLVLPAIQRELVWSARQICQLFDSIMQGYPIGALLYWKIKQDTSRKFKFYDFMLDYHERDQRHCPKLPDQHRELTGVLDGQQRLTALNIGLRGSMAWKLPRKHWKNPRAFPTRYLHLDLLWQPPDDDETGRKYRFAFRRGIDADWAQEARPTADALWFPVRRIMSMDSEDSVPAMVAMLTDRLPKHSVNKAFGTLFRLYKIVHARQTIAYYEERCQDIETVLQVFIRTNSGGSPLSYSDMLLSTATAHWKKVDARREIHRLVDDLNAVGDGFGFSKDLVLKASLVLTDLDVGFKVRNFTRDNTKRIEDNWQAIKKALLLTVQLVSGFGFNNFRLRATSAILPIAYYLHRRDPGQAYLGSKAFVHDREAIRAWLIRGFLKASGIWGSGLDTLLRAIRTVIAEDDGGDFPVDRVQRVMAQRGRSLAFEEEEVDELVDMQFGDRRLFALLSLLFPGSHVNGQLHVDHVFPRSSLTPTKLRIAELPEANIERIATIRNGLGNLQLLNARQNLEKGSMLPSQWLADAYPDPVVRRSVAANRMLGLIPESVKEFEDFYDARRARLKHGIERLLAVP